MKCLSLHRGSYNKTDENVIIHQHCMKGNYSLYRVKKIQIQVHNNCRTVSIPNYIYPLRRRFRIRAKYFYGTFFFLFQPFVFLETVWRPSRHAQNMVLRKTEHNILRRTNGCGSIVNSDADRTRDNYTRRVRSRPETRTPGRLAIVQYRGIPLTTTDGCTANGMSERSFTSNAFLRFRPVHRRGGESIVGWFSPIGVQIITFRLTSEK